MCDNTITVDSKRWWSPTGQNIEAAIRYRIQAFGRWSDASIGCGPDGYSLERVEKWKRPAFLLLSRWRPLDTGDVWFILLGRIGKNGKPFKIGSKVSYISDTSGELYCTVNDLPFMLWNNNGSVQIKVEREC